MKTMKSQYELCRRNFLKGLALPLLVPAAALGLDGAVAASERITMGLIGCGIHGGGWNTDLMLKNPEQQIVALCDVDREHLTTTQAKIESHYSKASGKDCRVDVYSDFRDLVNRRDIDAVDIVTPDHWHALMAVFAMKAGKHVICEKPTLTIEEGRKVAAVQKETGRVYLTASENRTIDDYQFVINVVRNGLIGTLRNIKVLLPFGNVDRHKLSFEVSPIPSTLDYEKWSGPAPLLPFVPARLHDTWRWNLAYSGGSLTDWGSHNTNLALWGMNDLPSLVELWGNGNDPTTKWNYPDKSEVWNTTASFDYSGRFSNGVGIQIWSEVPGIKFEGDDGWILHRGYRGRTTASDEKILQWRPGPNDIDVAKDLVYCTVGRTGPTALGNILGGEHVHFTRCIKTGQTPYYHAELSQKTHLIAHAGNISMTLDGARLRLNAETGLFEGDNAKAAQESMFNSRPQREPWTFDRVDSWINVG